MHSSAGLAEATVSAEACHEWKGVGHGPSMRSSVAVSTWLKGRLFPVVSVPGVEGRPCHAIHHPKAFPATVDGLMRAVWCYWEGSGRRGRGEVKPVERLKVQEGDSLLKWTKACLISRQNLMSEPEEIRAREAVRWRTDRRPSCQQANGYLGHKQGHAGLGLWIIPRLRGNAQARRKSSDWRVWTKRRGNWKTDVGFVSRCIDKNSRRRPCVSIGSLCSGASSPRPGRAGTIRTIQSFCAKPRRQWALLALFDRSQKVVPRREDWKAGIEDDAVDPWSHWIRMVADGCQRAGGGLRPAACCHLQVCRALLQRGGYLFEAGAPRGRSRTNQGLPKRDRIGAGELPDAGCWMSDEILDGRWW